MLGFCVFCAFRHESRTRRLPPAAPRTPTDTLAFFRKSPSMEGAAKILAKAKKQHAILRVRFFVFCEKAEWRYLRLAAAGRLGRSARSTSDDRRRTGVPQSPHESRSRSAATGAEQTPYMVHTWAPFHIWVVYCCKILATGLGRDRRAKKYRVGTCYCFLLRLISRGMIGARRNLTIAGIRWDFLWWALFRPIKFISEWA